MALLNTNPLTRLDDDSIIESSFLRIIQYNITDTKEDIGSIRLQFAIYNSKQKWIEDWRKNAIKIYGIHDKKNGDILTINYSRQTDGVDILYFLYTKLIEFLYSLGWDVNKLTPELINPIVIE